jgi:hypothetical protein
VNAPRFSEEIVQPGVFDCAVDYGDSVMELRSARFNATIVVIKWRWCRLSSRWALPRRYEKLGTDWHLFAPMGFGGIERKHIFLRTSDLMRCRRRRKKQRIHNGLADRNYFVVAGLPVHCGGGVLTGMVRQGEH